MRSWHILSTTMVYCKSLFWKDLMKIYPQTSWNTHLYTIFCQNKSICSMFDHSTIFLLSNKVWPTEILSNCHDRTSVIFSVARCISSSVPWFFTSFGDVLQIYDVEPFQHGKNKTRMWVKVILSRNWPLSRSHKMVTACSLLCHIPTSF